MTDWLAKLKRSFSNLRHEKVANRHFYGEHFADLWPKESRPILLEFENCVISGCIIASVDGPDKAELLNADGEFLREFTPKEAIIKVSEPPSKILLWWEE